MLDFVGGELAQRTADNNGKADSEDWVVAWHTRSNGWSHGNRRCVEELFSARRLNYQLPVVDYLFGDLVNTAVCMGYFPKLFLGMNRFFAIAFDGVYHHKYERTAMVSNFIAGASSATGVAIGQNYVTSPMGSFLLWTALWQGCCTVQCTTYVFLLSERRTKPRATLPVQKATVQTSQVD
ncbi:unnamed protein product, partial [Mesorhabditis belari]|uniref:Uncharacterized protein n=1 Tax=Mesorhabditis belari TaxID=2138241 RepID=A0AAF3FCW1_9BILA